MIGRLMVGSLLVGSLGVGACLQSSVAEAEPATSGMAITQENPAASATSTGGVSGTETSAAATASASNARAEDLSGRSVEWLLEEASRSYQQGDYGRAISLYRAVLQQGVVNGHLHYNLGNAYQREGQLGPAIQQYRIAELLMPRDGDVEANLRFARNQRKDKGELPSPDALHRLLFWSDALSPRELVLATLLLNALFWTLMGVGRFRTGISVRPLTSLAAVATVLCGASAGLMHYELAESPDAVVLEHEISARSGTDVRSVVLFVLREGMEVKTRSVGADWVQVDAGEGRRGWVERRFVGLIRGGEGL